MNENTKLINFMVKLQFITMYALKGYVITYIGDNKYILRSPKQYI